ncbi:hypothetical protein EVB27_104 [Rhizobium phage RHph_TM16]|nr:hypothetical protein EVB27_104 [Rhizobium phage RHph_TM16]
MVGLKDRWYPGQIAPAAVEITPVPQTPQTREIQAVGRALRDPKPKPVVKDFSSLADALKKK